MSGKRRKSTMEKHLTKEGFIGLRQLRIVCRYYIASRRGPKGACQVWRGLRNLGVASGGFGLERLGGKKANNKGADWVRKIRIGTKRYYFCYFSIHFLVSVKFHHFCH